ncbi:F1/F0 ATPase, subunit 2 [Maridesulfovibrio ferrireducens]|uniref:F1/F0 ATPase, subunit 2 n=2 Tax=Maridesulfovibrio ferrireducens TaxID=246191 RepID=A0A1G9LAJ9_9BACT|nr:F1/F0 ATPase, subunit 2 [Maridesulfovibrio ferrireducens]
MMSNNYLLLIAFFFVGGFAAILHFGGLWLTIRYLPRTVRPRLFFWSGCLLRYAVTLLVFLCVMKQGGAPLASAFLGFYLLRTAALSKYCSAEKSIIRNSRRTPWK